MISFRRATRIMSEGNPLPGLSPLKTASALGSLKPLIIALVYTYRAMIRQSEIIVCGLLSPRAEK